MRHSLRKKSIPAVILMSLLCAVLFLWNPCDRADKDNGAIADEQFGAYTDELFRREVSANPLTLHYTLKSPADFGIVDYSTEFCAYSAENVRISAALAENISAALNDFDEDSLATENRLTRDVLLNALQDTIAAAEFPYYEEPLRPSTGVQSELPILLAEYSFSNTEDIQDYLEILSSIPDYLDSICIYEQEKLEQGLFMSDAAAKTIISQCEDFAAAGEESYLIYTFEERTDRLTELTESERAAYREQNLAIVTDQVLPAFQKIADTLTILSSSANNINDKDADNVSVAAKSGGEQAGLFCLPLGTEYYALLIRQSTGSSDSVRTLKKRISAQRALDLAEMAALFETYPDLDTEYLLADAPCETPEDILELLKEQIAEDFPPVEDSDYAVKYVDPGMEDYLAPAFYLTSPLDDTSENSIYINEKNGYDGLRLFTTLAHEGYPGHLYQNVYFNSTDPSPIRTLFGPAGYSEGWATYVEILSYQYAGLSEPLAKLLSLEQSAVLSLYATADLYIHSEGWSFADTLDFFSDYGFSDEETIREIYDLIAAEPAHYLKYYVGYIEFLNLKEYAAEIYGSDYTDYAFHQAILDMGPAPFAVIKKYLTDYYDSSDSS